MSERLELTAHAKVNLTLEVLGKRSDGFHEIRSVMQRISLADTLTIEPSESLSLTCSDPALEGTENLVWRAAELLRSECSVKTGAALRLEKRVPVAAGLGGGSSDCAAALRGLNQHWRLGLRRERLMELGARLGSDVPFFMLDRGCALVEGRGERLRPLARLPVRWLVLAKPEVGISAAAAYRAVESRDWSDGSRTMQWLAEVHDSGVVPPPFNGLERAALRAVPAAEAAKEALLRAGAAAPVMSGSGSTYFALTDNEGCADEMVRGLRAGGWERAWKASFVTL